MTRPLPGPVRLGRALCGDLAQAERREWWLANGLGAYAAGTVAGTLTRRYHGLLVAPVDPPVGRRLMAAKAEVVVSNGTRSYWLATNRWADGSIAPRGHLHLESFALEGRMPVWRYALGDARLEQRVWMERGRNTTRIAWRLEAEPGDCRPWRLRVAVLANSRDHHHTTAAGAFTVSHRGSGAQLVAELPGAALHLQAPGGTLTPCATWYERFGLAQEAARGLDALDNHLCVAELQLPLPPGTWCGLSLGLGPGPEPGCEASLARHRRRDAAVLERAAAADPGFREPPDWVRQLLLAADGYLFTRPLPDGTRGRSVIAGYPWFGDWGRDTMIALPGLTLCTGRRQSARRILETFARYLDAGMVPNLFPGSGERPEYNAVDAALWYVEAWRACLAAGGEPASEATWQALRGIAEAYAAGTRYGIAMDPADGLLHAGAPGVQLTWMDAKVGDWVVTPRGGKPVEVNALWYNALRTLEGLAAARGDPDQDRYGDWAARVRRGFARYLRADGRGLLDVLDGPQGDDARLRPNQILAVSLPHSPLEPAAQRGVVEACARHLAVSCGLRSLAPGEPGYQGRYQGDVTARDAAYHQGTAWTWLLGPFASAHLRVHGDPEAALRWLEPLGDHLLDGGLGTLGEICDGDPPHQPRGAPSQAWSVACVLEAWSRIQAHRRG